MYNYMHTAIEEAKKSGKDVPVGAVVVKDGKIISVAHNLREQDNDITAHAEILAIRQAERTVANWRLDGCELYVTLEPCPMCGWAILQSRISKVYFGSYDLNYGAFSKCGLDKICKTDIEIHGGICEEECDMLLKDFFTDIRV